MATIDDMLQAQSEELTTCSICTEKFSFSDSNRTPKMLPCMHTFCNSCIIHHHASVNEQRLTATSSFPCPSCRKTCYVPLGGVDRFPTDHKVAQILDLMKLMNGSTSKVDTKGREAHCFVCSFQKKHVKAKNFCLECKKLLCDKCSNLHLETSVFRDHKLYEMDFEQQMTGKASDRSMCRPHESQFKYKCETCKENLCSVCVMMPNHARHDIQLVSSANLENSSIIVDDSKLLASILDKKWSDIGENVEKLSKIKEEQLKSHSDIEANIKNSAEEAIKMIKEEQARLVKEVKSKRDKISLEINESKKKKVPTATLR